VSSFFHRLRQNLPTRNLYSLYAYVLLALLITLPMPLSMNSSIFGYTGDSTGSIYDLWIQHREGLRIFGTSSVEMRGFPFGYSRNDWPFLTSSLLIFIGWILMFVLSDVFVYNLLILSGLVLSGWSMYGLLRYLNVSHLVAWWSGAAFTLLPFHQLAATAWYSQVHFETLPMTLLCLLRLHEKICMKRVIQLLIVLMISLLTNAYIALMAFFIVLVFSPFLFVKLLQEKNVITLKISVLVVSGTGLAAGAFTFLKGKVGMEVNRSLSELDVYGLRLKELFFVPSVNTFLRDLVPTLRPDSYHGSNLIETSQFVGYLIPGLAVFGFFFFLLKREQLVVVISCLTVSISGFWMGASQGLSIFGVQIPSPARQLSQVVPFWRVFSRFGIVVALGLIVVAGLTVARLVRNIPSPKMKFLAVSSLFLITMVEFWSPLPGRVSVLHPPSYVKQLDSFSPAALIAYPVVSIENSYTYDQNFWQRIHQIPMANSGKILTRSGGMNDVLSNIRDSQLGSKLAHFGIQMVLLDKVKYQELNGLDSRPVDPSLMQVWSDERYVLYKVRTIAAQVVGWYEGPRYPIEMRADGSTWRWLTSGANLVVSSKKSGCYSMILQLPSTNEAPIKLIDTSNDQHKIDLISSYDQSFNIKLTEGINEFKLDTQSTQLAIPDGRTVTLYAADVVIKRTDIDLCE